MKKTITLYEERDFGQILSSCFKFVRENFKKLFPAILMTASPFFLIAGAASAYMSNTLLKNVYGNPGDEEALLSGLINFYKFYFINYGLLFLAFLMLQGVLYEYILLYKKDKENIPDSYTIAKGSFKHIGKVLFGGLVSGVIMLVGFIICVLPGIYFWVVFSFLIWIMIYEKKGIGEGMTRCFELIKENWWSTFVVLLVIGIIQGIIGYIFNLPASLVGMYYGFMGGIGEVASMPKWLEILQITLSAVGAVFAGLCYVLVPIGAVFQYFNLVEKKEGVGLASEIEKLDDRFDDIT